MLEKIIGSAQALVLSVKFLRICQDHSISIFFLGFRKSALVACTFMDHAYELFSSLKYMPFAHRCFLEVSSKSMLAKIQQKYVDCPQLHELLGFGSKADNYVHENYSLRPKISVVDLVQFCTKSATLILERREHYVNLPCTNYVWNLIQDPDPGEG